MHFVSCLNRSCPNFSALVLLIKCSKDTKCSALLPHMDSYPSLGFVRMGFFLLRGCGHLCWTAAGPGGRRGCVSGEGHFWGKQERKLGWMLSACRGSTLAQLPPCWAAGAIQPSRMGRAAGSLLYPSKCSASSHDISQQNLPGVKRKKRDRKGTRDKERNKVKKCAVKLLAAKCGESHFQLLSSQRWSH